ncbi:unnamed protein product [Lactuca saligna]|uniref:HMA domain-containing protein n=2 Tax=Lactuca saligna TaxID=75948 RepID=A0AA35ZLL8_LACSI|nr:unnamed protein product [Lactuca saligna]
MNVIFVIVEGDGAKEGDDSVNQLKTYPAEKKATSNVHEIILNTNTKFSLMSTFDVGALIEVGGLTNQMVWIKEAIRVAGSRVKGYYGFGRSYGLLWVKFTVGKGLQEEYEWPFSSGLVMGTRVWNRERIRARSIVRKMWIKKFLCQRPQLEGSGFSLCVCALGLFTYVKVAQVMMEIVVFKYTRHSQIIIHFTEMAKQKIVVKVTMNNEKKIRKALKIAVSLSGVESASFVGSDKTQIAVTGEHVDSVELATLLRKGVGYTELLSVGPVEEKKPAAAKETNPTVAPLDFTVNPYQYYYGSYGMPYYAY